MLDLLGLVVLHVVVSGFVFFSDSPGFSYIINLLARTSMSTRNTDIIMLFELVKYCVLRSFFSIANL